MNIVYVNHGTGKDYAFYVPDEMAKYIKKNDVVVVETMHGISTGICKTGVICGEGALDKAIQDGAYMPIKPVIGKLYSELKAIFIRELQVALEETFMKQQDELPF